MQPREVRRKPLALALLWCNYAAQADGLETWWMAGAEAAVSDAEVDAKIAAARADDDWPEVEPVEDGEE